jgi:hypothetical protein
MSSVKSGKFRKPFLMVGKTSVGELPAKFCSPKIRNLFVCSVIFIVKIMSIRPVVNSPQINFIKKL